MILMHSSLGANEVLRDLLAEGELELDPDHTIVLPSDRHRQMLVRAAEMEAYTIVGRIPFLNGKIDHEGLAVMVQGDVRLRRPYVVVVATAERIGDQQNRLARQLAGFLRRPDTQDWIARFGIGEFDIHPLFFPVEIGKPRWVSNGPIEISSDSLSGLERKRVHIEDRGEEVEFEGVFLADLLKRQGIPMGEQLRGQLAELVVVAEARDQYRAAFSLAELDPATGGKEVLIADRRDGRALDEREGPYRLVVPDEARHVRWVRMLQSIRVTRPSPINVDPTRND
jgi:hypothetical protein